MAPALIQLVVLPVCVVVKIKLTTGMNHLRLLQTLLLAAVLTACTEVDVSKEVFREDEAEQGEATGASFRKLVEDYRTAYVARGAHAKAHACLRAYFDVSTEILSDYRYGVFAEPGRRYKTWVRFSNGHYDLKTSQDYEKRRQGHGAQAAGNNRATPGAE